MSDESKTLSAAERESLLSLLGTLDAAAEKIAVAMKPFREAACAIDQARETALEHFGTEVFDSCEVCAETILMGDKYQPTLDAGPLCEQCAATWGDLKKQAEEMLADDSLDDEDQAGRRHNVTLADEHVTAGGSLDDKPLYTAAP